MKKYSKIKRVGHDQNKKMFDNSDDELVIKEKLDGANFRWTYNEDGQPVFGSKNVEYTINGEPDYSENVDGRFTDAIEFIREITSHKDLRREGFQPTRYTFYGENMVSHSLEYEWEDVPQVIGFDVYDEQEEEFLGVEESQEIFSHLGLPYAPIVEETTVEEFRERHSSEEGYTIPKSQYRDGKGEGVVIINTDQEEPDLNGFNYRAKLVTEEFKEKHKEATGARQSVEAIHGHERAVSKFCTDARIRKHIHKMEDAGHDLGMEMMSPDNDDGLYARVAKDIVEEEYDSFVFSDWKVDFSEFRNLVAKRCAHVLKQEVQKL